MIQKSLLTVLFLTMVTVCSQTLGWESNTISKTAKIYWHSGQTEVIPFQEKEVCHLFSWGTDFLILGKQVKGCFDGRLEKRETSVYDSKKAKIIIWYTVPIQDIPGMYVELKGMPRPNSYTRSVLHRIKGFYFFSDKVCNIVAPDDSKLLEILGHEIRHCFDLNFHDNTGRIFY